MTFNEFKKELKGIKFSSKKDWEIFLPYDTKIEILQAVIDKCKENMLLDWHRVHSEVDGEEIKFYWDRKNLTSTEQGNMIIPAHMYAFATDKSRIRNVEVPDDELEKAKDVTDGLELVFYYGQNEFQQKKFPSVSVGDVIEYFKGRYFMVMSEGFKELSKEDFDSLQPPTSDIGYGFNKMSNT